MERLVGCWRRKSRRVHALIAIFFTFALWCSQGCRAQPPWQQWEQYASKFIDPQGRVVDHSFGDGTTSEGQAYAMFFALVTNDRPRFDKLLKWTEENLAGGDLTLRLPAWHWGKDQSGHWGTLDPTPASDADIWMAYSLMEAGQLWKDARYTKLGQIMASRIAQTEVAQIPGLGTTVIPGPQGFHPDQSTWILNTSYLPLPVLTYFAKTMPQGPWGAIVNSLPQLVQQASSGGFEMDWAMAGTTVRPSLTPAQLATGKNEGTPVGSFEAIRVYLWLGISDPATPKLKEMLQVQGGLGGMVNYMRNQMVPPQVVELNGKVTNPNAPVGFSAAVAPFLKAEGLNDQAKTQFDRLTATRDPATGLFGPGGLYFDQNLAMFGMGWSEQRFRFDKDGRLKLKWK